MKLLFISLMENVWGGSEELWYETAKYSLDRGDNVFISIHYPEFNSNILELINKGASVIQRPSKSSSILGRIIRRFFGLDYDKGDWKILKTHKFDHVLISFGGAYDIHAYKELQTILYQKKINYSLIQQYNRENIYLSEQARFELRQFFQKAVNTFFVSERNKLTTERNLVYKLINSKIVSNPAKNQKKAHSLIIFPSLEVLKIACVARYDVGIKNQDMLIQVLASDQWKSRSFQLNLFGKGAGEEYLRQLISFYGLEDKVNLMGHVNEINDVWKENHCMILPSSSEGSPLSIIEAMYCSRSIIATNVGGNYELIDNSCGFIIDGVDIKSIEKTLEEVWMRRYELKEMGEKSRQRILKIHNNESYKEIYNSISI